MTQHVRTTQAAAPRGPFETAAQAAAAAGPMCAAIEHADPGGAMDDAIRAARRAAKLDYATGVLAGCGVELGAHDQHIVRWLATMWDPETTAVILDWVARAHDAALAEPPACDSTCATGRAVNGDGGAR